MTEIKGVRMEFRLLGPLEVRAGTGESLPLGRRKQRLLLAILLLDRRALTTDTLIDRLWPEQPPASATANLYSYLSELRRVLPGRLDGNALALRPGELDADRFAELARQGLDASSCHRYELAVERLTRALGRWRTPVVAEGLPLPADLRPAVAHLERVRRQAGEALFEARLALGLSAGIITELEEMLVQHPLDEPLWALLLRAHHQSGDRTGALTAYRRACALLDDELGIGPGPALRDLRERIVNGDPVPLRPAS
jgi:DNA-binding SARP family transcriptional activator